MTLDTLSVMAQESSSMLLMMSLRQMAFSLQTLSTSGGTSGATSLAAKQKHMLTCAGSLDGKLIREDALSIIRSMLPSNCGIAFFPDYSS